jgi:hypothetical protein
MVSIADPTRPCVPLGSAAGKVADAWADLRNRHFDQG